jgi:hypothetical protein
VALNELKRKRVRFTVSVRSNWPGLSKNDRSTAIGIVVFFFSLSMNLACHSITSQNLNIITNFNNIISCASPPYIWLLLLKPIHQLILLRDVDKLVLGKGRYEVQQMTHVSHMIHSRPHQAKV